MSADILYIWIHPTPIHPMPNLPQAGGVSPTWCPGQVGRGGEGGGGVCGKGWAGGGGEGEECIARRIWDLPDHSGICPTTAFGI